MNCRTMAFGDTPALASCHSREGGKPDAAIAVSLALGARPALSRGQAFRGHDDIKCNCPHMNCRAIAFGDTATRQKRWLDENRQAFTEYNDRIERDGLTLERFRQF